MSCVTSRWVDVPIFLLVVVLGFVLARVTVCICCHGRPHCSCDCSVVDVFLVFFNVSCSLLCFVFPVLCCAAVSLSLSIIVNLHVRYNKTSLQALVTDAPTHSRRLKVATKQSCIRHGRGVSSSDVTGGNAGKSSRPSTKPRQRIDMVTTAGLVNDRCDTTVAHRNERNSKWQNRHVEQHQHSTAESISKTNRFPTSFQETGKAATTRDNFDRSICKRGQTKEKQCVAALRKFTNLTAVDCRHFTRYCAEQQQTNH